jgi:hypothetical protein
MTKKLIGYFRPNLTGEETPEEKEKKVNLFTGFLVRQVIDNSNGMFGEISDEEILRLIMGNDCNTDD